MIDISTAQSNLDNLTVLVGKDNQDMAEIRKRAVQAAKDIAQARKRRVQTKYPYVANKYAHRAAEWQYQLDDALAKVKS